MHRPCEQAPLCTRSAPWPRCGIAPAAERCCRQHTQCWAQTDLTEARHVGDAPRVGGTAATVRHLQRGCCSCRNAAMTNVHRARLVDHACAGKALSRRRAADLAHLQQVCRRWFSRQDARLRPSVATSTSRALTLSNGDMAWRFGWYAPSISSVCFCGELAGSCRIRAANFGRVGPLERLHCHVQPLQQHLASRLHHCHGSEVRSQQSTEYSSVSAALIFSSCSWRSDRTGGISDE